MKSFRYSQTPNSTFPPLYPFATLIGRIKRSNKGKGVGNWFQDEVWSLAVPACVRSCVPWRARITTLGPFRSELFRAYLFVGSRIVLGPRVRTGLNKMVRKASGSMARTTPMFDALSEAPVAASLIEHVCASLLAFRASHKSFYKFFGHCLRQVIGDQSNRVLRVLSGHKSHAGKTAAHKLCFNAA